MTVKPPQLHLKIEASQATPEVPAEQQVEESPNRETSSPQGQKRRHRTSPHRHRKRPSLGSPQAVSPCQPGPSQASPAPISPRLPPLGELTPATPENELDNSAYNSEDEYDRSDESSRLTEREMVERERRFEVTVRQKGFIIKKMDEDGACLFRAVADQIYGDQTMHDLIRQHCMDYIMKNADYFSQYVTEPFDRYVERKRRANAHGNHIEMQALSEMFNRPIEVYHYSEEPINIFHGMHNSGLDPIRLSYHRGVHYNSIVDPFKATVGVGLGLPGFQPGLADKNLLMDAIRASEQTELERRMLKDKLLASDYEATNEALERQVAHESYLEYLRENEKRYKKQQRGSSSSQEGETPRGSSSPKSGRASPKVGCSSQGCSQGSKSPRHSPRLATVKEEERMSPLPCTSNPRDSPRPSSSKESVPLQQNSSFFNDFPPEMFGLEDYDDGVLARVLAESQEEYIRQLKKHKDGDSPCSADTNQKASTSRDYSMH